ncbi:hypothetical protein [Frateuria defendens]|uniref:hypothetical protein n=1 Tax=Frateuria defendens TaxID=2219559 RepID=UPI000B1FF08C|nr:hypothetical protein [Frateuria defendens]
MAEEQAKIIVGASPVGIDQRHAYLLFERSDGSQIVVRGGPDARAEGNDLANFAESTLLGSDKFGNIRVDADPYIPPYAAVFQKQADGSVRPLPVEQANPNDPALARDPQGQIVVQEKVAYDWPLPSEKHERVVVWQGTDQELEKKLNSALTAGQQINDAKLEYSPLYNNSNGVASTLLKSADVAPSLPLGKDGEKVDAPNFGENLYQDVGLASNRSGYWFDGKQWYDSDDRKIKPPQSGEPTVPLDPNDKNKSRSGSFDSSFNDTQEERQQERQAFGTGDPDLDRLAAALFANDEAAISRVSAQIEQSPQVQSFEQWGRDLVAAQQREELQQQEMARQQGPVMRM